MVFEETELMREDGGTSLLKVGCRHDKVAYCVIGSGSTLHFDDYEDALEEFNLRLMRKKYD